MNKITKYSVSPSDTGGGNGGDVERVKRAAVSMSTGSESQSTASVELKRVASSASQVGGGAIKTITLTRKDTGVGSEDLSKKITDHSSPSPSVTFTDLGSTRKGFVIGTQGIGGKVRPGEEISDEIMDSAVECYDKIIEIARNNPGECPKFPGPGPDEYFWYSPEDKTYYYKDTDGVQRSGSFSGWPEEEEIFSLLNEQTRGSMKSGVSMGVSEISQELGHHSYGMNKPEMRSGVTTSLSSHKGSLKDEEYEALKTNLKTDVKKALVGNDVAKGTKYDANLGIILNNYTLLKKATTDRIKEIEDAKSLDPAALKSRLALQQYLNELNRMDLFAIAAASTIKGKGKKEQVLEARKLANTIYEQHLKNQTKTDKMTAYRPKLFGYGGPRHSTNRDVFVYASQIAAMAIDSPIERAKFLKDQVNGENGRTLLSIIAEDQGLFIWPGTRMPKASAELQSYLKDSNGSIDHPESLAERLLLESDGTKVSDRIHKALTENGATDADAEAVIDTVASGITGSADPKDDIHEWESPPLNT